MDSFYFISDCEGVISDSIYVRFISFVQSIENKDTFVSTLRLFSFKMQVWWYCECVVESSLGDSKFRRRDLQYFLTNLATNRKTNQSSITYIHVNNLYLFFYLWRDLSKNVQYRHQRPDWINLWTNCRISPLKSVMLSDNKKCFPIFKYHGK